VIQKPGQPTFVDFMCDRACPVSIRTSSALRTLMHKRRKDYESDVETLRYSFYYKDYYTALCSDLGGTGEIRDIEQWERRVGLHRAQTAYSFTPGCQ
jgi:hypothetical protein